MVQLPKPTTARHSAGPFLLLGIILIGALGWSAWTILKFRHRPTDEQQLLARHDSLKRFAARSAIQLAEASGWVRAYKLLPEYLPKAVQELGPMPELREIAIAALTKNCSSTLNHISDQAPAFSADSRWIITLLPQGTIVFSDVNFLDPNTYALKISAKDFRVDQTHLYYQTDAGWQRAALHSPPDGAAKLAPAEAFLGAVPTPNRPPPTAVILPRVGRIPSRLTFQGGIDPETPIHPLTENGSTPYAVILSPDGRFAAEWVEGRKVQIWRLALLRERLRRLGLDWKARDFPPPLNDEKTEASLQGAELVLPAYCTITNTTPTPSPQSPAPTSRSLYQSEPRRRVVLPTRDVENTFFLHRPQR